MAPVDADSFSSSRWQALRTLLDDPSPSVREALVEAFKECGLEGIDALRLWAREDEDTNVRNAARTLLEELVGPDVVGTFVDFIRAQRYELETGVIILNRVVQPDLDVGALCQEMDAIAERCRQLIARPATIRELCRVINRVIFHEYGFRGNKDDFENPANSLIGEVMQTRKGLPITLGVLYLLVARRVGLEFEPICLPGRFMIAYFGAPEPVYVDAFDGGRLRTPGEVSAFLEENGLPVDVADLAPAPISEVLLRFCRNLANHYEEQGDLKHAQLFAEFVLEFAETYRRSTS